MNTPSIDEMLNKAFALANFILRDRRSALSVVEEATTRLNVTMAAQGKRRYYKPIASTWMGGKNAERYRNKVLLSDHHLLQRLIYIVSEPAEKLIEESLVADNAGEEQMLIHFMKHLARITTRRNSFYVTLGINRLLYNYTTAETMDVYNAVIQDPARVKDDYYYRSRKGVLMQELRKRFGSFLDIVRGPRGEERFLPSSRQDQFVTLVGECLSFFTPWNTLCLVPPGVNPIVDGIAVLSSQNKQDEDKIEMDRMHAVLHPDCYSRLIGLLGFDPPQRRLHAPQFILSKENANSSEGPPSGQRTHSSSLSNQELDEIKGHLDDQSARRKRAFAGMLRVLVNGEEHARFAPTRSGKTRFEIDRDLELIEVRSTVNGDDLLLASRLFGGNALAVNRQPDATSIIIEGGQKIAITVTPDHDAAKVIVDVSYKETKWTRAASAYFTGLFSKSTNDQKSVTGFWKWPRVPALVAGVFLLLLTVSIVIRLMQNRSTVTSSPDATTINGQANNSGEALVSKTQNAEENSSRVDASPSTTPRRSDEQRVAQSDEKATARATNTEKALGSENQKQVRGESQRSQAVVQNRGINDNPVPSTEPRRSEPETTRSTENGVRVVPLVEVRNIYVEVTGNNVSGPGLRESMIARIKESNRFRAMASRDEADALLRLTIKDYSRNRVAVSAALINAKGEVIWRGPGQRSFFEGSTERVAVDIVKGLLEDVSANNGRQ